MPLTNNPTTLKKRDFIQALLILLVLLFAFFWRAIFTGEVMIPANLIFETDALWQSLAPTDYQESLNQNLGDQVAQFYPWEVFARRSLAQGELPFWNPFSNGGQSFIGNAQSGLFNPFNLIGYLFSINASFVVEAFLRLFVAGFFTFLFARQIGIKQYGALLAMVVFSFGGPMIVWVGYPLASVVVWLPALLFAVEKFLITQNRLYLILGALVVAVQFLGGHPETSFPVLLFVGSYILFRTVMLYGRKLPDIIAPLGQLAGMFILGFLLSAIQLFPFLETLWYSDALANRQGEIAAGRSLLQSALFDWHEWPTLVTLLLPDFLGTPLNNSYWYPFSNYVEIHTYAGVLPLALAISLVIYIVKYRDYPYRKMSLFFAGMVVISIGLAVHLPLINFINELPIFNLSASGRFRLIYLFCMALLAGFGLDNIVENNRFHKKVLFWILLLFAVVSVALIGGTYLGFTIFEDKLIENGRAFMETQHGKLNFTRPLQYYYDLVVERQQKKLELFHPRNVTMYFPLLVGIIVSVQYFRSKSNSVREGQGWFYLIFTLTVLDLFLVGNPFNSTTRPENIFPKPEVIQILQEDTEIFRISATDSILNPNSSMIFELEDIRGYDPLTPHRYINLILHAEGASPIHHHSLFIGVDDSLFDLLNVKYVLSERPLNENWEQIYGDDNQVKLYRNLDRLPRAFVVHQLNIVNNADDALAQVVDGTFNFDEVAVLETMPSNWLVSINDESVTSDSVGVVAYEPNYIHLKTEGLRQAGLLVLTDAYMPGWKAFVDGNETEIYATNYAFRGIVVPKDAIDIEFVYSPKSFWIGSSISLISLLLLFLIGFYFVIVPRNQNGHGN